MLVANVKDTSLYDHVHRVLAHPGIEGMEWHRTHSTGAAYTRNDAKTIRPVCQACVQGAMRQASTDHLRVHREPVLIPGSQFALDAYTHTEKGCGKFKYCDLFTDLTTRRVYPVFTRDRGAQELCDQVSILFESHPEWRRSTDASDPIDRFIRVDAEKSYRSVEFMRCIGSFGYRIEPTPPRDKHANGVAERTVGVIVSKCNTVMLAPSPPVPPKFWDVAMSYVCTTMSFNYNDVIKTSPYHMLTKKSVSVKHLHAFWTKCWVHIPTKDAGGKLGHPRAYQARFIGYDITTTLEPTYKVIEILEKGKYGAVRISKDVIFDIPEDIVKMMEATQLPLHAAPPVAAPPDSAPPVDHIDVPDLAPLHIAVDQAALPSAMHGHNMQRRSGKTVRLPPPAPPDTSIPDPDGPIPVEQGVPQAPPSQPPPLHQPALAHPMAPVRARRESNLRQQTSRPFVDRDTVSINTPIVSWETDDAVYWYSMQTRHPESFLTVVETSHYDQIKTLPDPGVPKTFWKAMKDPPWAKAIDTELTKFEVNSCLQIVPYTDQHLVPMMWLFSIKNDGTKKARLVGRGDKMIPNVDFDPDAVYCGNVSACSIKIALAIAAVYKLVYKGGDLVGAYLITRANKDYPVFIKTPQGYEVPPGYCIQAIGNLYGFPPAGQNFSIEFDKCLTECGYKNTPWDLKFFFKWTKTGIPMIIIAHSDDFRWFGPPDHIHEWDAVIATFNKHGYEVTDATDKEFVGIRIQADSESNYYMDQHRMIDLIINEANISGAKDEHLPYPSDAQQPPLSKLDCPTSDVERDQCQKYPYRRVVGQLMYGMVHTMVCIVYALNILSRYGHNPGPRHILFLKHLLRYVKYSKKDRLMFKTHDGPYDMETMTKILQLRFQCDADLGGNQDNCHSQTCYLGYLAGSLICWCSTDQGSVSTSTAESEIKAVNHTLKSEVISTRGILEMIGWKQQPTIIEEDNQACVYYSKTTHMTRNLRHLSLAEAYAKEKVADGTCIVVKVASADNNSDIGTKRVSQPIFTKLTSQIVDRSLRNNL